MASSTQAETIAGTQTMAKLRDRVRPLLIFAQTTNDPKLEAQLRTLREHAAEARDRDLVQVALPYEGAPSTEVHFTHAEAQAARRRFRIQPGDFAVILIGKDGGEKLRSSTPFSMEKLISTIDAMPMRQEEMRKRPPR